MFTTLYNVVFPALGSFFGCISRIATLPTWFVLDWLFGYNSLFEYTNLFTGNVEQAYSLWANSTVEGVFANILKDFVKIIMTPVYQVLKLSQNFLNATELPFWVFLLLMFTTFFITFSIIKFIIGLIR